MAGFFDGLRARMAAGQPTASPATPQGMVPEAAQAPQAGQPWGGFTNQNILDYTGNQQVYDLAQQTGQDRDTLVNQRNQFLYPLESSYRTAMGGHADATSANLYNSPDFRSFVQTGQAPKQGDGQTLGSLGVGLQHYNSLGGASQQYAAGSAVAPFTGQFQAPTADEAIGTPGMQYALERAQQAIERSAAAKGTLLTGGTLRDLSENQIGMALQGYQGAYNNKRSEFDLGRSIFESNQDRPFDKYYKLGELGRPA